MVPLTLILFFTLLFVYALHVYKMKRRPIPGPIGIPVLGYLKPWYTSLIEVLTNGTARYGKLWGFQFGPVDYMVNVIDPETLEYISKTKFDVFQKSRLRKEIYGELLGDGLFVATGESWKLHRKMTMPLFKTKHIKDAMVPTFIRHASEMVQTFENVVGSPVEILSVMMHYTMTAFLDIGLGAKDLLTEDKKIKFATHFDAIQAYSFKRSSFPFWKYFPNPAGFAESLKYIDDLVYGIIAERKKDPIQELKKKTDILSIYMSYEDKNGKPFDDKCLRDVFMNLLLAGRDTTASLISWTLKLLSDHPEVEKKVLEEISSVIKGPTPTYEELEELKYTKQVLSEVLRLYPSVPINNRECLEDTVLPTGQLIKKGTIIGILPYVTGRCPDLWENPLTFDPDRFLPEKIKNKHPYAFVTFHGGPQVCLGQDMSYIEAKTALVALLPIFKFELLPNQQLQPMRNPVFLPANGMFMKVTKRNN